MDLFYGFDLGDAESAVARLRKGQKEDPEILPVRGAKSFVSAYALTRTGETLIGESACYTPKAVERKIRFKSRFLTDPVSSDDIRRFASGVLANLYQDGSLRREDDCSFHIGCPAGWDRNVRERYREIFEKVGFPPVRIVTESRAALMSACQSKHLQVGYDILSKPMLVVDMGSSTTDFAYILRGREIELQTAGEVFLGGGIMDEILLEECVEASMHAKRIREVFAASEPWRAYCEFSARRLKEKYFNDEAYWQEHPCEQSVLISYRLPVRLPLKMNRDMASKLLYRKSAKLGGRSFAEVFCESLRNVRSRMDSGHLPELLFLTGGVSRLAMVRQWCQEVFPDAVVIAGSDPEFSVARGLAWSGAVDEELREFKKEIDELERSDVVERIVEDHITDLYSEAVNTLVEPILKNAAVPVFLRWRKGEIKKLADIDGEMQKSITNYLHSNEAKGLLIKPISKWLKPVAAKIEELTIPICIRHNVPYRDLSLTSYLSTSEIEISVDAKDVFAMDEVSWMINAIISVLVGMLCSGGGAAMLTSGFPGLVAGTSISLLVLFLGKNKMQDALLNADIPATMRHLIPKSFFESRVEQIRDSVQQNFYQNLREKQASEISERMAADISAQIENCLTKMAEVVEIPLG